MSYDQYYKLVGVTNLLKVWVAHPLLVRCLKIYAAFKMESTIAIVTG